MNLKRTAFATAIILNLFIGVITAALFVITAQSFVKSSYNEIVSYSSGNSANYLYTQMDALYNSVQKAENTNNYNDFDGSGEITYNDGLFLNCTFQNMNYEIKLELLSNSFDMTRDANLFLIKLSEIEVLTYSLKQDDNAQKVYFLKKQSFLVEKFNFDNVLLADNDGLILASSLPYSQNYFNYSDIPNTYNYKEIKNDQVLFYKTDLTQLDLKLVVIAPASFIKNYVNRAISLTGTFTAVILMVNTTLSALFLILLMRIDYKSMYRGGKVYFISTDISGRLKSADRGFKKRFDVKNIFDYIYDKENLPQKLNGGFVILMLVDNDNKPAYIRCASKFEGSVYKLTGYDVSELFTELVDTKKQLNCDMVTGLSHDVQFVSDYEETLRENLFQTFAVALIEITNSSQLKTMFGNDTYFKLQKNFSDKLTEMYSPQIKVYYSIEEKYILFADNTMRSNILINTLTKNIEKLQAPVNVNENTIKPVIKAGINKIEESMKYSAAVRDANIALKYAKISENKNVVLFDSRIMSSVLSFFETKESIIALINSNKFQVHYQPQYDIKTKRIVGFEALTRIVSSEFKNISVQEFIETAERNGAIIELGAKIYGTAMEFAKELSDKGVAISLNVSPIQLMQDGFTEMFLNTYRSLNLKEGSISIEITESFLMKSYEDIINKLLILRKAGIRIHLDDFGTAYSSMLYLNKLPIDAIKIDKEFVKDISFNEYSKTIVGFMIKLSSDLQLKCIIEGVENSEQTDIIQELSGNIIQGYYISRAVPQDKALLLLKELNK